MPDPDVIAERLRVLLGDSGMTKGAFAKHVGASYNTWFQWERGRRTPGTNSLYRISRKCRVSIPWLLGESPIDERGQEEFE
jgi:transcriptional regulator with XRE-family HTH domain